MESQEFPTFQITDFDSIIMTESSHQPQRRFTASMTDIENSLSMVPVNAARCHNRRCVQLDRDYKHQIANLLTERAKYMHIEVAIRDRELEARDYQSIVARIHQQKQDVELRSKNRYRQLSAALATAREDIQRLETECDAAKQATHDVETRLSDDVGQLRKELTAAKDKGRAWVVQNVAKIQLAEDRLVTAKQATRDMESVKNQELQQVNTKLTEAQQKHTKFELQTSEKMKTLVTDHEAARDETRNLKSRQEESDKHFKRELEVANRKISQVETSKYEAVQKVQADLDRASTKIKCLEDQLSQEAATTAEIFRIFERTIEDFRTAKQAQEGPVKAAKPGNESTTESLDPGTRSDATIQEDGARRAMERSDKESDVASNAGSTSTITVDLPQVAPATATSTTSPKAEPPNTIPTSNNIGPCSIGQPQTEQPEAAFPTPTRASIRFIMPPPTGPSASRRRSADGHAASSPLKKQKIGQTSASEPTSQSSPIDPYIDPRRQPRKGVAYRKDSRKSR